MANRKRGNGEGSISHRSNGRWRAQVSQDNGHRISRDFKTQSEAQSWLHQMQVDVEWGFDYQGSKILLKDYIQEWLNIHQVTLRPETAYGYRKTLNKYIFPRIGEVPLKDLTPQRIEQFYAQLLESGAGPRTVHKIHIILHSALEKAVMHGLLLRNPTANVALPRYTPAEMKVLDEMQVNQFLVAAIGSPFEALYHLAVKTGMRQGELLGLKWGDLHWGSGRLCVQRQMQLVVGQGRIFQEPKTRAGRRVIQLGEGTLQVLRIHHQRQEFQKTIAGKRWKENDLIFPSIVGTPKDAETLRLEFKRILEKAGLSNIRFHDLRHTAASLLLNNGIPLIVVSKILGHSQPSITLNVYGHLYTEMQDEAAKLMDELVSPVKVSLPAKTVTDAR